LGNSLVSFFNFVEGKSFLFNFIFFKDFFSLKFLNYVFFPFFSFNFFLGATLLYRKDFTFFFNSLFFFFFSNLRIFNSENFFFNIISDSLGFLSVNEFGFNYKFFNSFNLIKNSFIYLLGTDSLIINLRIL
jgi:hypothetical protein